MTSTRFSIAFSFAERYGGVVLRVAAMVVLARLLTPEEFGAYATAAAIVALGQLFANSGPDSRIIAAEPLTPEGLTAACVAAVIAAALPLTAIVTLAGPVTGLVHHPDAGAVLAVLAATLVLAPLRTVCQALLKRRMAFGPIALMGVGAAGFGSALSVGLALAGMGPLALAIAALAEYALITVAGLLLIRRSDSEATVPMARRPAALWPTLVFTARVSVGAALSKTNKTAAMLLTAGYLGDAAAGLLNRGRKLTSAFDELLLNAVTPVILPSLAAARRAGIGAAVGFRFKVEALAAVAWPFFLALALLAEPLVALFLGAQWGAAVPVVQLLCLAGVALPFHVADSKFLILLGLEKTYLRIQLLHQCVGLGLLFGAAQLSLAWIVAALVASQAVKAVATTTVICRALDLRPAALAAPAGRGALLALATVAPGAAMVWLGPSPQGLLGQAGLVFCATAAGGAVWLVVLWLLDHPLWAEVKRVRGRLSTMAGRLRPAFAAALQPSKR